MNKMFLAALLAISGGSIATADTLLGRVADSEGNPVEFATVVALSANHEQGGAVTDSIGNYRIDLPKGQYNVTFTLVGYDNAEKAVTVSGETRLDATMTTNAVALHGVEVKASAIRRLPDRFVVRVEDMPAAIGKDGKELLQAAPGVWIDDKKITINGKSGAKVMVNDRELRMDQSQLLTYLRSLKAEDVSKIEVIPQAGAEYSADTAGGIIKITLKRNRADGVMGNVSLIGSVSKTSATVTPSASVNVKNGNGHSVPTAISPPLRKPISTPAKPPTMPTATGIRPTQRWTYTSRFSATAWQAFISIPTRAIRWVSRWLTTNFSHRRT